MKKGKIRVEEEVSMMLSVFDVAKYILTKCGRMSTMKLQKLCYYSQAWSLVWDDEPLFDEEFEAWANGPVCAELFYRTQGQYSVEPEDEPGDIEKITSNQKDTINKVLAYYGKHDAQWLSRLTHLEEPWKIAREGIEPGASGSVVISKASMAQYYGGL